MHNHFWSTTEIANVRRGRITAYSSITTSLLKSGRQTRNYATELRLKERSDVGHRVVRDIRLSTNLNQISVKRRMDPPLHSGFMDI